MPAMAPPAEDPHYERLLALLDLERREEEARLSEDRASLPAAEREARGELLGRLECVEEEGGLAGRTLLTFERPGKALLPPAAARVGECVALVPPAGEEVGGGARYSGVVARRSAARVTVAFEEEAPEWLLDAGARLALERLPDATSFKRLRGAIERVRAARGGTDARLFELREVFDGRRAPERLLPEVADDLDPVLDDSQREAVRRALRAPDVALIHGPPGTGKTTAVVALVRAAVARGERVLACAASNAAVDVLCERLLERGIEAVRIGHPARISERLLHASLDERVRGHDDAAVVRRLLREADVIRKKIRKIGGSREKREARRALRDELFALVTDARRTAALSIEKVLESAPVVCGTLTGAEGPPLLGRRFDLAVIDEAAQALEPACWIAIARARRVVLAGDHFQLGPTVVSPEAARRGLARTLFERLAERFGEGERSTMLTVQYRMHERIAAFSSAHFYGGRLRAAAGNAAHRLAEIAGVRDADPWTRESFLLFDTSGAGFEESRGGGTSSVANEGEARLAAGIVRALLEAGVAPGQIGAIAPYSAQVAAIRELLAEEVARGVEVDTADGFQGREKEAIVLSLTRCNEAGEIGFLADYRRANVAITRARRALFVLADGATLGRDRFYRGLFEWAEAAGGLRSAWEILDV
jgi:superfamily I DNA and/or RNA helicase